MVSQEAIGIVGVSPLWLRVLEQSRAVASADATVLILGESGVGKELVAHQIHELSGRTGPLVTVNCASIPRDLFESEFFGHVRGAFTGATRDRKGRLEAADGGTLFLDEVAEIPVELQSKLLRALQDLTFQRVGDHRTRRVDVRLMAATNRDLAREVSLGRFRRDLYFRLSVFPIEVPPLRARPEDIPPLVERFLTLLEVKGDRDLPRPSDGQLHHLLAHDWPGNVRELKNVVERACILSRDGVLALEEALPRPSRSSSPQDDLATAQTPARGFFTAAELKQLELSSVVAAMEAAGWKVSGSGGAAELLGVKPSTLSSRLKAMAVERPEPSSLYVRLGGRQGLVAFARELFGRVLSDAQLGRFWEDRSNAGVLREERLLVDYLSGASGGPRVYVGRDMRAAHRDLGITAEDWSVFRGHLAASLDALRIADDEHQEFRAFAESLKSEIVSI